jgi:hypothetical protein
MLQRMRSATGKGPSNRPYNEDYAKDKFGIKRCHLYSQENVEIKGHP